MKKTKYSSIIVAVIVAITMLTACEPSNNDNTPLFYKDGEMIANNIINTYYLASEKLNFEINSQQNLVNVLASRPQNSKIINLVDNYNLKVQIFALYSGILKEFEQNNVNENIKVGFINLLNSVDSLNTANLMNKTELLRNYVLAANFDAKVALYETTNLMNKLWLNDVLFWKSTLENEYIQYAKVVDQIPETAFDEAKLEKFVYAPYSGKGNLVNVYKLNLKQDAFEINNAFNNRANILLSAFDSYSQIIGELNQAKPNLDFISLNHEKILAQLNTIDKYNN